MFSPCQPIINYFFVLGLDGLVWKFSLAGCVTLPRVQSLSAHTQRHSPAGAQPTSSRQAAHNDPQGDRVQGHCVILHNRPGSMCQPIEPSRVIVSYCITVQGHCVILYTRPGLLCYTVHVTVQGHCVTLYYRPGSLCYNVLSTVREEREEHHLGEKK